MAAANPRLQAILDAQEAKNKKLSPSAAPKATPTQERKVEKDYNLENNTFAKIVFSDATPEEKRAAIAKALVYDVAQDKDQNAARQKEFEIFKEYLQSE